MFPKFFSFKDYLELLNTIISHRIINSPSKSITKASDNLLKCQVFVQTQLDIKL